MKITDKLAKAEREGRPFWSFEYFPPRTAQVSGSSQTSCSEAESSSDGRDCNVAPLALLWRRA